MKGWVNLGATPYGFEHATTGLGIERLNYEAIALEFTSKAIYHWICESTIPTGEGLFVSSSQERPATVSEQFKMNLWK